MPEIPQEAVEAFERVFYAEHPQDAIRPLHEALDAAAPFLAAQEREGREKLEITVAAQAEYEHDAVERLAELQKARERVEKRADMAEALLYGPEQEVLARCAELEAERQEVIACVNLFGDETLHKALDEIGWPASSPASVDPGGEA